MSAFGQKQTLDFRCELIYNATMSKTITMGDLYLFRFSRLIFLLGLLAIVAIQGCRPKPDISKKDPVEVIISKHQACAEDKTDKASHCRKFDTYNINDDFSRIAKERAKRNLSEYFEVQKKPDFLGWKHLEKSPNDQGALQCFSKLNEDPGLASFSNVEFEKDTIKTTDLSNGTKIGVVDVSATTKYGRVTKFRTIFRLDICHLMTVTYFHDFVRVSPAKGGVAHSSISNDSGDSSLFFYKFHNNDPFDIFVNSEKNGLMVIKKPELTHATYLENKKDKGCLFSVLEKGEAAAQTAKLSSLCPNSGMFLEPKSLIYPLTYYWFGQKEITELKTKEAGKTGQYGVYNQRYFAKNIKYLRHVDKSEYILDLRIGLSETPMNDKIDLAINGYVWSPHIQHERAWENSK